MKSFFKNAEEDIASHLFTPQMPAQSGLVGAEARSQELYLVFGLGGKESTARVVVGRKLDWKRSILESGVPAWDPEQGRQHAAQVFLLNSHLL